MTSGVVATFSIGAYEFEVRFNTANVTGAMQRDIFYKRKQTEWAFLRSFFFDETQLSIIQSFCERIAEELDYEKSSLERTTDWATCNDFFLRNCFNPYFQPNPVLEKLGSMVRAYYFFKEHTLSIMAHPDYQKIYEADSAIIPDATQPDPKILLIITALNHLDRVRTLASCQGVSGIVRFQDLDILTLSSHARYAYIWFAELSPYYHNTFRQYAATEPAVMYTEDIYPTLRATGDNPAFLSAMQKFIHQNCPPSG